MGEGGEVGGISVEAPAFSPPPPPPPPFLGHMSKMAARLQTAGIHPGGRRVVFGTGRSVDLQWRVLLHSFLSNVSGGRSKSRSHDKSGQTITETDKPPQ